jgi:hypothetical protein
MQPDQIRKLVQKFEHKSSYGSEPGWEEVRALGASAIPYFIEAYSSASHWRQRASFLYSAIPYARRSAAAVDLAILALSDRAREVRYRACMLLACSLDRRSLPYLEAAAVHSDESTRADAQAAIDAIIEGNHHYFVDRTHSGKVTLNIDGAANRGPR